MFVAFTGHARSGKDTAVRYLVDNHEYLRVSIAEPVYNILYATNPIVESREGHGNCCHVRVQELVDAKGWETAKVESQEIRELLQRLAVEGIRTELGESTLIDRVIRVARERGTKNTAVSDLRFAEESSWVRQLGGVVVRITRPGVGPINSHVTEQRLPDNVIDFEIVNDSDIPTLYKRIEGVMNSLRINDLTGGSSGTGKRKLTVSDNPA